MNIEQKDLNLWRGFMETLRRQMLAAHLHIVSGSRGPARDIVLKTASAAARMGIRLEQAGAERPPDMPPAPVTPLELLDTPANRHYLALLHAAWEAGLAVDRERYGESIGTDGEAQMVELLIRDKELEIYGPARDESKVG